MAYLDRNFIKISKEELSIEWQIPGIFSMTEDDDTIHSPEFYFSGARWSLSLNVWAEQEMEENPFSGRVAIQLTRCTNKLVAGPPETIHIMLGIKCPEGVETIKEDEQLVSYDLDDDEDDDWNHAMSRSELKTHEARLVPNNVLTIVFELKKDAPAPSSARGVEKLQKSLRSMLLSGEDSDIVIKVQGNAFPCHKGILRSRSDIFRAMFSHNMVENQSGVVTIDDCDPQTFSDFLDHVYTGSSEKISSVNVLNLYMVSDKYGMDTLKEQCVEFVKRNLSVASFCDVMKLAVKHEDKELTDATTQFFCENSSDIVTTAEWQAFYEENSGLGYQLFIKALTK